MFAKGIDSIDARAFAATKWERGMKKAGREREKNVAHFKYVGSVLCVERVSSVLAYFRFD